MSTKEATTHIFHKESLNTELVLLMLQNSSGHPLPRVLQLSPASSDMIRAMLFTTIKHQEAEVTEDIDPISHISASKLLTIGKDQEIREIIDSLLELNDKADRELVNQVLRALNNGKKGQDIVRGLIGVLCAYALEPSEAPNTVNEPTNTANEPTSRMNEGPAYTFLTSRASGE